MPTRAQFLSTGLVPIVSSNFAKDDQSCAICSCDFSDAVRLPCGHKFDGSCISKWLQMDSRNTCPFCKTKLFDLPAREDRGAGNDFRDQVAAAIRTSRVSERDALNVIETYGCDTSTVAVASFQRASAHASHHLGQNNRATPGALYQFPGTAIPVLIDGPAVIRTEKIAASFLAMGNLIPALARAQGRAYTRQQSADWTLSLRHLWYVLRQRNGKRDDVVDLSYKIWIKVQEMLSNFYSDAGTKEFFFQYSVGGPRNLLREDMMLLLDYLTLVFWTIRKEEDAVAEKEADAEVIRRMGGKWQKPKSRCTVM